MYIQDEHLLKPIDLLAVLEKARKEDDVEEEDQPLHIDDSEEAIKCHWFTTFKGSQEVKHVNQHTLKSSSRRNTRKWFFGINEENSSRGKNQLDIIDFFQH